MNRASLQAALANPNVRAFMALIRAGEGTSDADGYRRLFGGELFDSFADHPRRLITKSGYTSTAAGAGQFLSRTWDGLVRQYGFPDFSPACQDEGIVALIAGRGALADVQEGRIEQAIAKCAREWASLPGSPYGQPTRTLKQALGVYLADGGVLESVADMPLVQTEQTAAAQQPATQPASEGVTMPPFLLAAIPSLIQAIPKLAELFGTGSDVSNRNVAAVQTVAQIVQDATGSKNIQEAVEAIQSDPAMLQSATKAVQDNWYTLIEAGGGGIEGARKADIEFIQQGFPLWRSPSFVIGVLLMPLLYMIVGATIGLFGAPFSEDVRAAIANGVVGLVLGGLIGYYYGQSTSGNRTAAAAK